MKVLVVGDGGREHALAWRCAASAAVSEVLVAPGNAGTATEPRLRNVGVAASDIPGLVALARAENIALTIIGPETPLVGGVVDAFQAAGLRCFGPSRAAAQLEGSKAFSKEFLRRHQIPTAGYRSFTRADFDAAWLRAQRTPIVVKASGLAAGKGVVIAHSTGEALAAVEEMFAGRFGAAGDTVVVEEFLAGEEASFIVMADGVTRAAVRQLAGPQARRRRRQRAQYRRHGRVFARAGGDPGRARARHARSDRTHAGRSRLRWHAVHRLPLCRPDDR